MIKEKIINLLQKLSKISPVIWVLLFAVAVFGATTYYSINLPPKKVAEEEIKEQPAETPPETNPEEAKKELRKNPPKTASSGSSRTIGNQTIVSDGSISAEDASRLESYSGAGPASNITYTDTTGAYPSLGDTLKSYINNTLYHKSSDLSYMYEIRMVDCPSCGYGGLYSGSYLTSGSDIYKAFGFITLNVAPYKSSAYFVDYMKLILSHEYGHHYTLYHRWVDLDVPYGERFPDAYYNVRPLTKATTTWDYSLGWGNCDAEIIAEDYSYFYSTYGYHAMSGTYGLPSGATNSWIQNMSLSSPEVPADSTPPTVSITAPANGATLSGSQTLSANASDNVGVTRVEFYVDSTLVYTDTSSPYSTIIVTGSYGNGSHTLKAKAYDTAQSAESSITVSISNVADSTSPNVVINQPASSPYDWSSGDLIVEATGTDNIGVVKTEFYINGSLVAEENSSHIIRLWQRAGTPNGSYTLTAKAYDGAGNTNEASVTVNKS